MATGGKRPPGRPGGYVTSGISGMRACDNAWAWRLISHSVEALEMGPGSLTTGPAGRARGAPTPLPPGEAAHIRALLAEPVGPKGRTPEDWDRISVEYGRLCDLAQDRLVPPGGRVPPRLASLKLNRELAADAAERWATHRPRGRCRPPVRPTGTPNPALATDYTEWELSAENFQRTPPRADPDPEWAG